ncbi:CBS domain [Micromonospora zamorensis]|nr:CBS domain [Micromonospora zamorensis]
MLGRAVTARARGDKRWAVWPCRTGVGGTTTTGQHKVRRLPVIDGHELVGIVAVADVARSLPERPVGDLIEAISERS